MEIFILHLINKTHIIAVIGVRNNLNYFNVKATPDGSLSTAIWTNDTFNMNVYFVQHEIKPQLNVHFYNWYQLLNKLGN